MAEYIEREKVYEMLNALGGCDAEPDSWANGWDKAIDAAIKELYTIPTKKHRFGLGKCNHQWEILREISPDAWGFGGKIIVCCTKCGKIRKVRT